MKTEQAVNPLKSLNNYGQSVWLDYVRRNILIDGELKKMIREDGLKGMTSNPSIFEKAIGGSNDYDSALQKLLAQGLKPMALYEHLAIEDIQMSADLLKPVYDETKGHDGYVSLEVSPRLAFDTEATIAEARRLWQAVGRKNIMIKVPGTTAGIPALETLIAEGININVTLLFAQSTYKQVAEAFIRGLEKLAKNGGDVSKVASVASFFISRIDSAVDQRINDRLKSSTVSEEKTQLESLLGKIAVANARLTYQLYKQIIAQPNWQALAKKGAMPQRLLWASTSTKNPQYSDVYYVEELIGPDTVNTIPPATYDAFRDHGKAARTLEAHLEESSAMLISLKKSGISLDDVCKKLVDDGVKLFADAFDKLLAVLEKKHTAMCASKPDNELNKMTYKLGSTELELEVKKKIDDWQTSGKIKQLWSADASLWTNTDENHWLGWLSVTDDQLAHLGNLQALNADLNKFGFKQALLIGMGGSSLGPAVLSSAFGKITGNPQFYMLDSTVPAQIKAIEDQLDLNNTIFIVSSKSGSTLEPNILKDYFFEKVKSKLGAAEAGRRFIAVTDPGSQLEKIAKAERFRYIFHGLPSIGGRYSILSNFGMVPAAVIGLDLACFLDKADLMVQSCGTSVPAEQNSGVILGIILGVMANHGHDKITFVISPAMSELGAWLEQLLAESTGKIGKGLIPINGEDLSPASMYGKDRLFIYISLETNLDPAQEKAINELEKAGQPVVRIELKDMYDLAQEFFRFEIATSVAGSVMGINPFNQPDVEASKVATRNLTSEYEKSGKLVTAAPSFTVSKDNCTIELFTDQSNWLSITKDCQDKQSLAAILKSFLGLVKPADYIAILGYMEMSVANKAALGTMRQILHDNLQIATCLGFGPRYLHSTGQVYKGGPNTGVFLQLTADDTVDLPVPGKKYTFSLVKTAQALGDYQVLTERKRRIIRAHIKGNLSEGLTLLLQAIKESSMPLVEQRSR